VGAVADAADSPLTVAGAAPVSHRTSLSHRGGDASMREPIQPPFSKVYCSIVSGCKCQNRCDERFNNFGGADMDLFATSLIGIGTAGLTALFGWWGLRRLEIEKGDRARRAAGVLFQSELIQLRDALSEHNRYLHNHASEVWNSIDKPGAVGYKSVNIETPIFDKEISNVGLFKSGTSFRLIRCYFNIFDFKRSQSNYSGLLVDLRKAPDRGRYADDLDHELRQLLSQISEIIPKLAAESQSIPISEQTVESIASRTHQAVISPDG
jgi:hypothetical protein